jgi:cytochrome c biogenesis protein CcmG, thiol:disulfide interchange protein DsbE
MRAQADRLPVQEQLRHREGVDGSPRRLAPARRILAFVLVAAALAALAIFGLAPSGGAARRAPELSGQVLVGPPPSLPALLAGAHGGPVLVVFWASWCGPCQSEARAVARFSASPNGRGRVVGVNWSDAAGGASAFLRRYRWTFPNLRDPVGEVGYAYGITVLPTTFVVGPGKVIEQVLRGPQTEASLERAVGTA